MAGLSPARKPGAAERSRTFTATARRAGARWERRAKRVASCGLRAQRVGRPVSALPAACVPRPARSRHWLQCQAPSQWAYPTPHHAGWATHRSARTPHGRVTPAIDARAALRQQGGHRGERTGEPTDSLAVETHCALSRLHVRLRPARHHARHGSLHAAGAAGLPRRTSGWRGGRPAQAPAGERSRRPFQRGGCGAADGKASGVAALYRHRAAAGGARRTADGATAGGSLRWPAASADPCPAPRCRACLPWKCWLSHDALVV